ncbi:MAG: penicillin-insensitive murein endopeptidase, partial [Burkholderiales bacterium]
MCARLVGVLLWGLLAASGAGAQPDFGDVASPSPPPAAAIGGYARGCLAGGVRLPADGPAWQVMRLSRNRAYGHPDLIAFIRALSESARAQGWAGLLVGDLAQPRGGPMRSGHGSHQTGLDADIWLTPVPPHTLAAELRESLSATSVVSDDGAGIDRARWTPEHVALLRTAAQFSQVDRIFVNPAIKRALCGEVQGDRRWLTKIRPWWGHDEHMHVRLRCPRGDAHCIDQAPVPGGDGCDAELDWWFSAEAREELAKRRTAPSRKLTIADLPAACRPVLL